MKFVLLRELCLRKETILNCCPTGSFGCFASRTHFRKIFSQFWEQDRKGLLTWFSVELEGYIHPIVP